MKPRVHFGNKTRTKAEQRTALRSLLVMRRDLDGLNHESLCRSYGLAPAEVQAMVAEETLRRRARG